MKNTKWIDATFVIATLSMLMIAAAAVLLALMGSNAVRASGEASAPGAWVCPIDKDFTKEQCEEVMKNDPGYLSEEESLKIAGAGPGESAVTSYNSCSPQPVNGVVTCEGNDTDAIENFVIGYVPGWWGIKWLAICHTYSGGIDDLYQYNPSEVSYIKVYGYANKDNISVYSSGSSLNCGGTMVYGWDNASLFTQKLYAWGGDGNDWISGGPNGTTTDPEYLYGGNGIDLLEGGAGSDYLYGSNGDDTIYCGDGVDWAMGEWGSDTIHCNYGNGHDHIYGGNQKDYIWANNYGTLADPNYINDVSATPTGNEITGGSGVDQILGDDGPDLIQGGFGADNIKGLGGDDAIYADPPSTVYGSGDYVAGGAGNDLIVGGGGGTVILPDTLIGGGGDDCIVGDFLNPLSTPMNTEGTDVISALEGNDCVYCDDAYFNWPGSCAAYGHYCVSNGDQTFGCIGNDINCAWDCEDLYGCCENNAY